MEWCYWDPSIHLFLQVLFSFRRCVRGEEGDTEGANGTPVMEDDRMGFIMFEAGLENVALKSVLIYYTIISSPTLDLSIFYFLLQLSLNYNNLSIAYQPRPHTIQIK